MMWRARLLIWIGVIATFALLLVASRADATGAPKDFAYGMVLDRWGDWRGPKLADGSPDFRVVDSLIRSRAQHVRVAPAPYGSNALMAQKGVVAEQMWRIKAAGAQLGMGINSGRPMKGSKLAEQGYGLRTAEDVIEHARRIEAASPGLYDFILLDFFVLWDEARAQRIVNGVSALGFKVIVNAGGVSRGGQKVPLPRGAWAFQRAGTFLGGPDWKREARRVARGREPLLRSYDRQYIRDVRRRRPESTPMIRFTVPEQVLFRFGKLSRKTQRQLLTRMAKKQRGAHFKMTFPLYVPEFDEAYRGGAREYDARTRGTFWTQTKLIRAF